MEKTISFALGSINNQIKRRIDSLPIMQDNDIKGIYGYVIGFLNDNRHRDVYQKDIEEQLCVRRSSVSSLLNQMEIAGLIERRSVDGDGRLKKVVLTQKAIAINDSIIEEFQRLEVGLREGMSEEEIKTLFALLEKVKANVENLKEICSYNNDK